MSSSESTPIDKKDEKLFAELDGHSRDLRLTAVELAEIFSNTENQSREISMLILAFEKIATGEIIQMDSALNNLKKVMSAIALHNDSATMFGPNIPADMFPEIMDKYLKLMTAAVDLAAKASELNEASN